MITKNNVADWRITLQHTAPAEFILDPIGFVRPAQEGYGDFIHLKLGDIIRPESGETITISAPIVVKNRIERTAIRRGPDYSLPGFRKNLLQRIVAWAAHEVTERQIGAVVAIGHSGLTIAGALAFHTGIQVFAVRKAGEKIASGSTSAPVTGIAPDGPIERWAFLDDFLSSGYTFRRASREVFRAGLVTTPKPAVILAHRGYDGTEDDEKTGKLGEIERCGFFDHENKW